MTFPQSRRVFGAPVQFGIYEGLGDGVQFAVNRHQVTGGIHGGSGFPGHDCHPGRDRLLRPAGVRVHSGEVPLAGVAPGDVQHGPQGGEVGALPGGGILRPQAGQRLGEVVIAERQGGELRHLGVLVIIGVEIPRRFGDLRRLGDVGVVRRAVEVQPDVNILHGAVRRGPEKTDRPAQQRTKQKSRRQPIPAVCGGEDFGTGVPGVHRKYGVQGTGYEVRAVSRRGGRGNWYRKRQAAACQRIPQARKSGWKSAAAA